MINDVKGAPSASSLSLQALIGEIDKEISQGLRRQQEEKRVSDLLDELVDIGRHVCFNLAEKQLAMPLSFVQEAGELQVVQPLPFLPSWLEGVTNLRGEIISVVALADLFDLEKPTVLDGQQFIVIGEAGLKTAVTVDSITGTRLLYRKKGAESAGGTDSFNADYSAGMALYLEGNIERDIELIHVDKVLSFIKLG